MKTAQLGKSVDESPACECDTFEFMAKELRVKVLHPGGLEATEELAERCNISEDMTILDVGCGRGSTSLFLAKKYGCRVIGVDMDQHMLMAAEQEARKRGLLDKVSFRTADANNLPFENESFDGAIIQAALIFTVKPKALHEIQRKILPGGFVGVLELAWKQPPPSAIVAHVASILCSVVANAEVHSGWGELLQESGLTVVSAELRDVEFGLREMLRNEGLLQTFRIVLKSIFQAKVRRNTRDIANLFLDVKDYLGYGIYVGKRDAT